MFINRANRFTYGNIPSTYRHRLSRCVRRMLIHRPSRFIRQNFPSRHREVPFIHRNIRSPYRDRLMTYRNCRPGHRNLMSPHRPSHFTHRNIVSPHREIFFIRRNFILPRVNIISMCVKIIPTHRKTAWKGRISPRIQGKYPKPAIRLA